MDETMGARKRIGLVAHDNKKRDLAEWAVYNRRLLTSHDLVATGTTGTLLEEALGVGITKLQSGPLGGDLQLGGLIADASVDLLIFFWDPLEPQPHDHRRPGAAADRRGLEHPRGVQPRDGRLPHLLTADAQRLRPHDPRLPGSPRSAAVRRRTIADPWPAADHRAISCGRCRTGGRRRPPGRA